MVQIKGITKVLAKIWRKKTPTKITLPKRNQDRVLSFRSSITCLVCKVADIEITEQGLCGSCGNVIM